VFLTPEGKGWSNYTTNFMCIHDRVLRKAGIPKVDVEGRKIDVHALRHTYATRLARADVGMAKTQRLLGHASIATTAEIYTHIGVEDLRGAVDSLARNQEPRDPSQHYEPRDQSRHYEEPRDKSWRNQEPRNQAREAQ
jgi:hypothetical protein